MILLEVIKLKIKNAGLEWYVMYYSLNDNKIKRVNILGYNFAKELAKQIKHHDESKWSEDEFDAYRANYNPINDQEKIDNEANFQAAWYNHFQNNPHHWQHWLNEKGELEPLKGKDEVKKAYIEMICDWQAMGYVFGDTAYQYYNQNKDTIKLYPELQNWVEELLNKLEKI